MALENKDLKRANHALNVVNENNDSADFKSAVKKLIPLIQNSGIIGTLAFAKSKGKEHEKVALAIQNWLITDGFLSSNSPNPVAELIQLDSLKVLRATKEALLYLSWLKRISDSEIEEPEDNEEDNEFEN